MNFWEVARFRKPDRENKQNKLSWSWGMWIVELGNVYSANSWTGTLSSESLFSPSEMPARPAKGSRIPVAPRRNVPTLPSLCQSPSSTIVFHVAFLVCAAGCAWGLEAGIRRNTPDSHTALLLPFFRCQKSRGPNPRLAFLVFPWNSLCCSKKLYHCYISDISQARNMQPREEVHLVFWFLFFFWQKLVVLIPARTELKSTWCGAGRGSFCLIAR